MKFLWLILELMYCISCCQFWYYLHHAFCFFYLWLLCLIKCLSLQCDSEVENVWQRDAFPRKALGDPVAPLVCSFIEWNNLLVWLEWVMNLYELNSCISFWEEYIFIGVQIWQIFVKCHQSEHYRHPNKVCQEIWVFNINYSKFP